MRIAFAFLALAACAPYKHGIATGMPHNEENVRIRGDKLIVDLTKFDEQQLETLAVLVHRDGPGKQVDVSHYSVVTPKMLPVPGTNCLTRFTVSWDPTQSEAMQGDWLIVHVQDWSQRFGEIYPIELPHELYTVRAELTREQPEQVICLSDVAWQRRVEVISVAYHPRNERSVATRYQDRIFAYGDSEISIDPDNTWQVTLTGWNHELGDIPVTVKVEFSPGPISGDTLEGVPRFY